MNPIPHIIVLHFTLAGTFYCDGLAAIHPGLRPVRIGGGLQPGEHGCPECPNFLKCGMSHVSKLDLKIHDLAAVEALCKEKGWTFRRNQKTHQGYQSTPGKCEHAIGVPGTTWEIGLVTNAKTGGYSLAYDFYGNKGQPLQQAIGKDGGIFLQGYGVAKATLIARSKGYMVARTALPNGTIRLSVTGV